jgi:hypothetical protein
MLFVFILIQLVFYTSFFYILKSTIVYKVLITSNCFCKKAIRCASPLSETRIEWRFND